MYVFRAKDFRRAFGQLHTLPTFFSCCVIALSATITRSTMEKLPQQLGMKMPESIIENPDKPNIFLDRRKKLPNVDIHACASSVYEPEIDMLMKMKMDYPVTLLYMPIAWMCEAQPHAMELFGHPTLRQSMFGSLFSTQDKDVV
jgi:hypothetical protein